MISQRSYGGARARRCLVLGLAALLGARIASAAPDEVRLRGGVSMQVPEGWASRGHGTVDPRDWLGSHARCEGAFGPDPAGPSKAQLLVCFVPEEEPTDIPPARTSPLVDDMRERAGPRRVRIHATLPRPDGSRLRYEAMSLEQPEGTLVVAFVVPEAEAAALASTVERTLQSVGAGERPPAARGPPSSVTTGHDGGAEPQKRDHGSKEGLLDTVLAILLLAGLAEVGRHVWRWVARPDDLPPRMGQSVAPAVPYVPRSAPPPRATTPAEILRRGVRRSATDGSLAAHGWAKVERELRQGGIDEEEARATVEDARRGLYVRERSVAIRRIALGAVVLTVGSLASVLSMLSARPGGRFYVFTGAVAWGIYAVGRGVRLWPARLARRTESPGDGRGAA